MRRILTLLSLLLLVGTASADEAIPLERQIEIISNFMTARGLDEKIPPSFSMSLQPAEKSDELEEELPPPAEKCGMWAALEYSLNYNQLDKDLLLAMNAPVLARPVLDNRYDSPGGKFKVHYTKNGSDAVWQADKDSDGDGVPDFVESTASILDNVYNHIIVNLGYPSPPTDGSQGGDERYDVYLRDLGGAAYGFTYTVDSIVAPDTSTFLYTTYMELDNDYQELQAYKDRPLDAIKVTAAHEYFHAVQFGIEGKEFEIFLYVVDGETRARAMPYWMEMSSVWMEEEVYDDINDYYYYLPFFYNEPYQSLQQFRDGTGGIHSYASGIFPLYLSEKHGPDVIHDIWMKCADTLGPTFLTAAGAVLDSITGDSMSWRRAVNEFAVWNFFTGQRAGMAPAGTGFEERASYPAFSDSKIHVIQDYPQRLPLTETPLAADHNGAAYMKLDQLQAFQRDKYVVYPADSFLVVDTNYWECKGYTCTAFEDPCFDPDPFECCIDSFCNDSARVYDTRLGYDWMEVTLEWCQECELKDKMGTVFQYLVDPNCTVDCETADTLITQYESILVDSVFTAYWALDNDYSELWSFSFLYQSNADLNQFYIEDTLVTPHHMKPSPPAPQLDKLDIYDPELLRSITVVATPASTERLNYQFTGLRGAPRRFGVFVFELLIDSLRQSVVDEEAIQVTGDILVAYPNPAVTAKMGSDPLYISYRVPTDNVSNFVYTNPRLTMDVYNVAGDYVRFVDTAVQVEPNNIYNENKTVLWEAQWDLKNGAGADVASGVYILLIRLYDESDGGRIVLEKTTKVAVIR
ncbi:MAG: hypothetical protein P1R58_05270 [bacterium]|nr:hypothetical protein [bacterium]